MHLRFLQTTPSAHPEFPFQPGQVIHLVRLTPELRQWIATGHAEIVRDEPETAVDEQRETAIVGKKRR